MCSQYSVSVCLFYLRLELEDLEMKHNSAVKQMMREFNTQVALKETEIDSTVRETIGKTVKTYFEEAAFSKNMTHTGFCHYLQEQIKIALDMFLVYSVVKSRQILT